MELGVISLSDLTADPRTGRPVRGARPARPASDLDFCVVRLCLGAAVRPVGLGACGALVGGRSWRRILSVKGSTKAQRRARRVAGRAREGRFRQTPRVVI